MNEELLLEFAEKLINEVRDEDFDMGCSMEWKDNEFIADDDARGI